MNTLVKAPPQAQSRPCVLCIDDEPHVLRSLQWLLQKDFDVHTCASAAEALRELRKHDFDVVMSDQRMPGITGVEFLRHVRKLSPRSMRLLLTGYSELEAMLRSVNESEVYRFVTKPWDVRALPKLVAEAARVSRSGPVPVDTDNGGQATPVHALSGPELHPAEALLVIDDDPAVHTLIDEATGRAVEVLYARDLASALTLLDGRPEIGVIVSEVCVGGHDATRLLRMLKARHPEIVSLVLSDQNDADIVMSLINQGQVYRIVPKPVKAGFIRILVDGALKRHRQLVTAPAVRRRFAVESTAKEVADSLLKDIMAVSQQPAPPASRAAMQTTTPRPIPAYRDTGPGMIDTLKAGFRRLFGATA